MSGTASPDERLRLSDDRRDDGPSQRGQQEAAAVHGRTVGLLIGQAGTMHGHSSSRISPSAFSSQYVMPMSRYIAVAVVRCSCVAHLDAALLTDPTPDTKPGVSGKRPGCAYWPRLVGSTPAKARKSIMRKSPVTRPLIVGSVGRQRECHA
jgi:hypothetical protein